MVSRVLWRILAVALLLGAALLVQWSPVPSVAEGDRRPERDPDIFDPRWDRVDLPAGYSPLLGRDAIRPIYDPRFVPADDVMWHPTTLVIGVAIDGEAKAYPVNVLNAREMIIDRLRGIPLLVSW
jgi:hypothetical protein